MTFKKIQKKLHLDTENGELGLFLVIMIVIASLLSFIFGNTVVIGFFIGATISALFFIFSSKSETSQ